MRRRLQIPQLLSVVRELREKQTRAERILWALLRGRRFLRLKFRRQERIGPFVADFCCHEVSLVIEVDGGVHTTPKQVDSDRNRDRYLEQNHIRVLRFTNEQVLYQTESVLRQVAITTGRWDDSVPSSS